MENRLGRKRHALMLTVQSVLEWADQAGLLAAFSGDHFDSGLNAKEMTHCKFWFHEMT